jgi:hypothetical protein
LKAALKASGRGAPDEGASSGFAAEVHAVQQSSSS